MPLDMKNKTGIFIVTYNAPTLLPLQVDRIVRHCKDDFELVIVDNSTDKDAAEAIHYHAIRLGCSYLRTQAGSKGGSESHAFACNVSYQREGRKYAYVLYLDHDNFPVKDFSVVDMLGDNVIAGLGQNKSKTYMWPGLVMLNNQHLDPIKVDFSCSREYMLDTGGMLFTIIEQFPDRAVFFDEAYCENPHFPTPPYNYYAMLAGGVFMHFVNGSNWNKQGNNDERVNSLINILSEK